MRTKRAYLYKQTKTHEYIHAYADVDDAIDAKVAFQNNADLIAPTCAHVSFRRVVHAGRAGNVNM